MLDARFDRVLGDRRGLTDVRAALVRLDCAEREGERARSETQALRVEGELLANDVARLSDIVAEQAAELEERRVELRACQSDRARARYALVRATGVDLFHRDRHVVHHGVWTPGRPFLFGEHVYGPIDGCCYAAPAQGLAPGHPPGVSRDWLRCAADAGCPEPVPVPVRDHPVDGLALRQAEFWWDAKKHKHALQELTDEHLRGVIVWLSNHSPNLWVAERDEARVYVPCPVEAYADDIDWLADTPLWRALNAEVARRGLVASDAPATPDSSTDPEGWRP